VKKRARVVAIGDGVIVASIMLALIANPARADASRPSTEPPQAMQCKALAEADFSNIVDAPAQINTTKLVQSVGELLEGLARDAPEELVEQARKGITRVHPYCRVSGYVAPNVGFELLLPTNHWNGKFLHVGCGGWCGTTGLVGLFCSKYPDYACIGTDMGHSGLGGLWFRNNLQAQIDFSYRATHVTTLAGKAITERYYTITPHRSYFLGCSTGGYQGMMEAQRFPWDFDGIVAGAPDMDESDLAVRGVWIKQNFMGRDEKPVLSPDDIQLIHKAALARCDMDDGVKDGIISDPMHCKFDPQELLCKAGNTSQCLSASQVRAVKNIYGAPVTSKGVQLSSRGAFPGSEGNWIEMFAHTWGDEYFKDTALLSAPGKEWKYADFDFDRDYARSGAGVLFADTNPDLRKFKTAGGKLISYQGGNDALEIPGAIFDYYETVEKTMGGRVATQEFFRLFAIPGMNHCSEGDGVFAFDYLSYLEAWVEEGRPPDVMIGAHVKDLPKYGSYGLKTPLDPSTPVSFTRPVYPYPLHAKYKGSGDPNKAENFRPVMPDRVH
jgi:Tannase and feruloyl esterase